MTLFIFFKNENGNFHMVANKIIQKMFSAIQIPSIYTVGLKCAVWTVAGFVTLNPHAVI